MARRLSGARASADGRRRDAVRRDRDGAARHDARVDRGEAAVTTTLDLAIPAQLTLALVPDLVLMGGAMILLLWAAWRPESDTHQRNVGLASIVLCGITILLTLNWIGRFDAGPGPIALDNFRWTVDVVILLLSLI